jgi:type II secretory pathway component PulF
MANPTRSTTRSGAKVNSVMKTLGWRKEKKPQPKMLSYKRRNGGFWEKLSDAADRKSFNWKTREAFYNHVATQSENGVTVELAVEGFAKILLKRKRKSSAALVENVARRMRDGMTFRKAVDIAVPREEVALIAGGELSGDLGKALDAIVTSHDRVQAVISAYRESMTQPLIYLTMTYAVLWGIGGYVMPQITVGLPESKVTGMGLLMYKAADFSQSWISILLPILFIALIVAIRWSLPRWLGPKRIAAEKYFPFSFYRDIEGYKWLTGFAGMIEAGMTDVHILARQMETASPWLRERLYHTRFRMTEGGMSLAKALEAKGPRKLPAFEFPNPDIIDKLSSIEGFSDFHERVGRLTNRWSADIERSAKQRAKQFGFYAEMSMYLIMGMLMISINSVTTQLGAIAG